MRVITDYGVELSHSMAIILNQIYAIDKSWQIPRLHASAQAAREAERAYRLDPARKALMDALIEVEMSVVPERTIMLLGKGEVFNG